MSQNFAEHFCCYCDEALTTEELNKYYFVKNINVDYFCDKCKNTLKSINPITRNSNIENFLEKQEDSSRKFMESLKNLSDAMLNSVFSADSLSKALKKEVCNFCKKEIQGDSYRYREKGSIWRACDECLSLLDKNNPAAKNEV